MNILSAVAGIAGNWVNGKVEESKAKSTARVEKAKADAEQAEAASQVLAKTPLMIYIG